MKLTINNKELLKACQLVGAVINNNHTLPIAQCFLFEAGANLKITATDLDVVLSTVVECSGQGSAAIPSRLLVELLKTLPDQPIELEVIGKSLHITAVSGKYKVPVDEVSEFPKPIVLSETKQITLPGHFILEGIQKTLFATSTEEIYPNICGVFFEFLNDKVNVVATDKHRISRYSKTGLDIGFEDSFIVPKKPLSIIKSFINGDDVTLEYNNINAVFKQGVNVITVRLVDGKYLNYDGVIPKEFGIKVTVNKSVMQSSLKRLSIFSKYLVAFNLSNNKIVLDAADVDYSTDATETLACDYTGDDFRIGLNHKMLSEILSNITCENILIEMNLPGRPIVITPLDSHEENERVLMLQSPVII